MAMGLEARIAARIALVAVVSGAIGVVALADDNERGEKLFAFCATCHGDTGAGNELFLAPAIAGMGEWYVKGQLEKFRSGQRGKHFDDIGGMRMRPMSLTLRTDEDVAAVAAWVASMPADRPETALEGGDAAKGKTLYTPCIACHGASGEGNPLLFGPPLAGTSDWYLLTQMQNFRSGTRGGAAGDTTGAMMRPMALTLPDEQALLDVIAHISTLSN
jgi:cytochrome c oxidase subunit 2